MKGEEIMQRASAVTIPCPYCGAQVDQKCFNPITGWELEHQPAHNVRMREAHVL